MEKLSFKTAEFEGPLDLLLYLIQKHKLDIYDISISALLAQYITYIEQLQDADLEVASEFLEMASRLVYIKTVSLLPRHEEQAGALRAELQGQLLEYQVCKQVAAELGARSRGRLTFVREPAPIPHDAAYRLHHSAQELLRAYRDAVGKGKRRLPPPAQAFNSIVARRVVSVGSRIIFLLRQLYRSGQATYEELFLQSSDRSELVATFLAVLELVKAKRITVDAGEVRFERRHRENAMPDEEPSYD